VEVETSIAHAGEMIRSRCRKLDLLINNVGIYPHGETTQTVTATTMLRAFRVNAVAPLLVAAQFLDLLRAGDARELSISLRQRNRYGKGLNETMEATAITSAGLLFT
jgi:NAD(P)-dependent dehydrogenase (short-subunit alcohol dehydrogenase family)